MKLADNAIWLYARVWRVWSLRAFTSKVVDSLIVGETENIGNPRTDGGKRHWRPQLAEALKCRRSPIRGCEHYDYRHDVEDVTFRNFEDNVVSR